MRFSAWKRLLLLAAAAAAPLVAAEPMLQSSSLNTCQDNSGFTASLFKIVLTPNNNSASVDIVAVSSVQGSVIFDVEASAYGYRFLKTTINPCDVGLAGLCPMTAGKIPLTFNIPVGAEAIQRIPSIAYNIPDLDAKVRVYLNMTDSRESVACVEAAISNGKTVDLLGVKWTTAIIAGLALTASAVVSGLGHSNAAAHVAANTLSLFGYFQAQAIIGLSGVHIPPIVRSWTQDFQWTMGIINVGWMQTIFTWYQRATGGTPATIFNSLTTVSVQVEKVRRSLDASPLVRRAAALVPRAGAALSRRNNITTGSGSFIVYGIQRVAFTAGIETTNLFMTGLTFFCIFVVFTVLGVAAFKGACELAVKKKWMKNDRFLEFRKGWFIVLKGILFRLTLIGFPQMTILCLWEFTQVDSPALVVLAVFFFFGMSLTLGWAAAKVILIARHSVALHQNPAYVLFSDPQALNKWGFLYVQFRASAYYFIVPVLGYTIVKGMFVALTQHASVVQAVAFIIIEAAALIAASVLRPWMDKSTNTFNIAICVMNFVNSIFLLIFTQVFGQPPLVTGVVGVILFVVNAAFSLILLILVIITTTVTFMRKNPDGRYQVMADDRASFMKSQTHLASTTTELDALAATARGDKAGYKSTLDLDDDNTSISSADVRRRTEQSALSVPPSSATAGHQRYHDNNNNNNYYYNDNHRNHYANQPQSPVNPSMPLYPADSRQAYPSQRDNYSRNQYSGPINRTPSPYESSPYYASPPSYRTQNNSSPSWQRGAGYQ